MTFDAIVIGGGPAGLSAALVLGRARRRTLVVDAGEPRNAPAAAAHGMFTRDGTPPAELLEIGRAQLRPYGSVELRPGKAEAARVVEGGFAFDLTDGETVRARTAVLATGVRDDLAGVPGLRELWGRGVYHCPYCHGWEVRDEPLAVLANGETAMHLAPLIRQWSADLVLLTDGPADLTAADRAILTGLGIPVREEPIVRLDGAPDRGLGVVFADGEVLARRAVFARVPVMPRTGLAEGLGCALVAEGMVPGLIEVDAVGRTTVPGVYAAGDVTTPMAQVVAAAAAGALAAAMLNGDLVRADLPVLEPVPAGG
ncbi:MAG: Thioredoxin reductase [uncultured Thermomicrobiales bacterium]|uniref:Thioredoxin reductase n=1 Tax=uncultured Thermomicrobiales bacterium TaxID=1645740 RepID=A0A6J4UPJ7_9BACT|nr:MAG: Thioredoxin reductase [uncultured Thermomicrobiales bacterium]